MRKSESATAAATNQYHYNCSSNCAQHSIVCNQSVYTTVIQSAKSIICSSIIIVGLLLLFSSVRHPQNKAEECESEWERTQLEETSTHLYKFHVPKLMLYFHKACCHLFGWQMCLKVIILMRWKKKFDFVDLVCGAGVWVGVRQSHRKCEKFTAAHLFWNSKPVNVDKWRFLYGYFLHAQMDCRR